MQHLRLTILKASWPKMSFHVLPLQIAAQIAYAMRLVWKSLDKMRCLRKRSTIPFLGFLITFLLFLNLYIEDGYVLVSIYIVPVNYFRAHLVSLEV